MVINVLILEDSVYIRTYHSNFPELCECSNFEDTEKNRKTKFVMAALKIENCNVFTSKGRIDNMYSLECQEELPAWFRKENALARCKVAFRKWHEKYVLIGQDIDKLSSGRYYLKNCKVGYLSGDVKIEISDNCKIDNMLGNASIMECLNTQIGEMFDNSKLNLMYLTIINSINDEATLEGDGFSLVCDNRNKEES